MNSLRVHYDPDGVYVVKTDIPFFTIEFDHVLPGDLDVDWGDGDEERQELYSQALGGVPEITLDLEHIAFKNGIYNKESHIFIPTETYIARGMTYVPYETFDRDYVPGFEGNFRHRRD